MKRKEGQDFEDYRKERKIRQLDLKEYLKGIVVWNTGTFDAGKNKDKRSRRNG